MMLKVNKRNDKINIESFDSIYEDNQTKIRL